MATLTGKLVADTYKALLKLIDNDVLTASEKQISDGFGGGSNVFIDQNGFLRAAQFKVTGGTSSQFLKGNGSLDSNTYLTAAVANALYLPIGSTTTAIAEGTRLYFTTARVLATTLTGFVATSGTVTASDTILSSIEKIWWNIVNGGGGGGGGYVPYIGATQNLNLGTYGLISDFVQFNVSNSAVPTTAGTMSWNNTDGTADLKLKGGNVTLQVGQEQVTRVVNKTGTNLLESQYHAVYISGAQGQRLKVDLALAVTDGTSAGTLGLVTENINNNQEGFVTSSGLVNEIDTTGDLQGETWADGDILYLSPLVAGDITNVKPLAPEHTVIIGFVVYAHANHGKIYVKVDNGYEIEELHDVQVIDRTDTDILQWYEDDLVWRNIQFATALDNAGGIIGLGDINYVPRFDGTNSISNSRIFDDLDNVIIGGTVGIIPNPFGMADMLTVLNGNIAIEGAYSYRIDTHQILQRTNATGEFRIGTDVIGDFITLYAGTSERARLTAAGYLGVGLIAPSSMIHAKDSTAYGKIIIDNTGLTGGGSFSARQNGTETAIFGVSGSWQANTTSDAAIVATRGGQGIKFYTDGSSTAKGGIDSVGNSFIGQLPAYYAGATNFIVQGISAAALIGITHADNSIKGVFSTLNSGVNIGSETPHPVIFRADDIESARIASDGKWLFGTVINDNVNIVQVNGSIIATSLKKSGGIATEFLKADGSVDSNTYYLASNPNNYIPLTAISSTAFGLTYTNTTGVISLTAGFEIPTTTDTTNWDIAYLNRITSATAPLSITTNVISISQASGSTNGYLSSTDWTTFNNKSNTNGTVTSVGGTGTVSGLTLTGTVTTSGSLTLGGTLSLTSGNVTSALGYTPVTNARNLTINGTAYDLSADRSWTVSGTIGGLTTNKIPKATSSTTLGDSNLINDASGNLGLGVTPSAWNTFSAFQIGQSSAIFGHPSANETYISSNLYYNTGNKYIVNGFVSLYAQASGQHIWFTAPSGTAGGTVTFTQAMTLTASGNLGLGTSTPDRPLDVYSASAIGISRVRGNNSNGAALTIQNDQNAQSGSIYAAGSVAFGISGWAGNTVLESITGIVYSAYNGNHIFQSGVSGRTERMRITAAGNVGIGTTSPAYIIDAYSTSSSAARINIGGTTNFVVSQYTNTSGTMYVGIDDSAGANFTGTAYGRFIYSSGAYPFIFNINGSERMRITSGGNVLIGTTTGDGYKLQIVGASQASATFGQTYAGVAAYSQWITSGGAFVMGLDGAAGATERMRIGSGGGVAIGTTTTSGYTLNVVRSASTTATRSYRGTGESMQLMARILKDETNYSGVSMGYLATSSSYCIYGNGTNYGLELGVFNGSVYKTMIVIGTTTIQLDLPTSSSGLANGGLWNDGGTVKIVV